MLVKCRVCTVLLDHVRMLNIRQHIIPIDAGAWLNDHSGQYSLRLNVSTNVRNPVLHEHVVNEMMISSVECEGIERKCWDDVCLHSV